MTRLSAPDGVLAFDRGGVACVANLASGPVDLPHHTAVLPHHTAVLLASSRVSLACAASPDHAVGVRGTVPAPGLTATMEHCCRSDSNDGTSLRLLLPTKADPTLRGGRAGLTGKQWRGRRPGLGAVWGRSADRPGTVARQPQLPKAGSVRRMPKAGSVKRTARRSRSNIDDDSGAVRHLTSQPPVRRTDEFLVDFQTSGPAVQAPGRQNRRAGAGERIDDHSGRR